MGTNVGIENFWGGSFRSMHTNNRSMHNNFLGGYAYSNKYIQSNMHSRIDRSST